MKASKSGFTLIELMVVISIIALLSSIVLGSLKSAGKKADIQAINQNMLTIRTQAEIYRLNNNNYSNSPIVAYDWNESCFSQTNGVYSDQKIKNSISQISKIRKKYSIDNSGDYMTCWVKSNSFLLSIEPIERSFLYPENYCVSSVNLIFGRSEFGFDEQGFENSNNELYCF